MTLTEYIEKDYPNKFDEIDGFTIGNGKRVYWYIIPTKNGMYRCLPSGKHGILGWARYVRPNQIVRVVNKSQKDL